MAMDRRRAENADWFEGRGSPLGSVRMLDPTTQGGGDNYVPRLSDHSEDESQENAHGHEYKPECETDASFF